MLLIRMLGIGLKAMEIYHRYCQPVCRQYGLNQTAFDIVMFIANNPEHNTARDLSRIRGIKSGIASVTVDSLIRNGYLYCDTDPRDRRIHRLLLTEKTEPLVRDGRAIQLQFGKAITANLTSEEKTQYVQITMKLVDTISHMDRKELQQC